MAISLGTASTVHIAVDGDTPTYALLGKVTSGELTITTDIAEGTNNDSGGFKEFLYADTDYALSGTVKYDAADAQQTALFTACATRSDADATYLTVRVRPSVVSSAEQWAFRALCTSFKINMSHGEVNTASFEFRGTVTPLSGTNVTPVLTVQ